MNILNNERGFVLAFVAMGLLLFMLFLGVALDTGWTVYVRSQGQARVDSAALAGAAGLFDQNAGTRETAVKKLAEDFSDTENPVLETDTDQDDDVIPMHYNPATQTLSVVESWAPPPNGDFTREGANAVRVQNAVPTPLFFSGVRNVVGANETGTTDINVDAVGFLGCPGGGVLEGIGPLALRACRIPFPSCDNREFTIYQYPDSGDDNSAFTSLLEDTRVMPYCRALANGTEPDPPIEIPGCSNLNLIGLGRREIAFVNSRIVLIQMGTIKHAP